MGIKLLMKQRVTLRALSQSESSPEVKRDLEGILTLLDDMFYSVRDAGLYTVESPWYHPPIIFTPSIPEDEEWNSNMNKQTKIDARLAARRVIGRLENVEGSITVDSDAHCEITDRGAVVTVKIHIEDVKAWSSDPTRAEMDNGGLL